MQSAQPGDDVGFALKGVEKGSVWKGCVAGHVNNPPNVTKRFKANILVVEHPVGVSVGYCPTLYCHHEQAECCIESIEAKINPKTGEVIASNPQNLIKGDAAIVWISTKKPIAIEKASTITRLSRFALRDMGATIAVGICVDSVPAK